MSVVPFARFCFCLFAMILVYYIAPEGFRCELVSCLFPVPVSVSLLSLSFFLFFFLSLSLSLSLSLFSLFCFPMSRSAVEPKIGPIVAVFESKIRPTAA